MPKLIQRIEVRAMILLLIMTYTYSQASLLQSSARDLYKS